MPLDVLTKRIYDRPDPADVLIDHIWPRGVTRADARLDEWARALAPSDELRKWFGHDPERFGEFRPATRRATANTTTPTCSPSSCATAESGDSGERAALAFDAVQQLHIGVTEGQHSLAFEL